MRCTPVCGPTESSNSNNSNNNRNLRNHPSDENDESSEVEACDVVMESSRRRRLDHNNNNDDDSSSPFLQSLWARIAEPCLGTTTTGDLGDWVACSMNPLFDDEDLDEICAKLLMDIGKNGGGNKARTAALQRLYRLTDKERQQNRIPVICTNKFQAIPAIVPCLKSSSSADRRQALLLLSNLCIPTENKTALLLGSQVNCLLRALLRTVRQRGPEAYLATVCLFNLSFLPEGKPILFEYVPPDEEDDDDDDFVDDKSEPRSHYRHYSHPSQNPRSLIRTLESAVRDFLPFCLHAQAPPAPHRRRPSTRLLQMVNGTTTTTTTSLDHPNNKPVMPQSSSLPILSCEGEVVHWSMAIFRNLSTVKEAAVRLANETIAPTVAIQTLQAAMNMNKPLALWKADSLEDASLTLLLQLAHSVECQAALRTEETMALLTELAARGDGIHERRAAALWEELQHVGVGVGVGRVRQQQQEEKKSDNNDETHGSSSRQQQQDPPSDEDCELKQVLSV